MNEWDLEYPLYHTLLKPILEYNGYKQTGNYNLNSWFSGVYFFLIRKRLSLQIAIDAMQI